MSQVEHQVEVIQAHGRRQRDFYQDIFGLVQGHCRGSAKDISNCQKGKPRHDSRKQLPEAEWRSNQEGKGFEELDFRQNKRSASYITGWIFMFYIKHWGPSVSKYSREGVEFETQPVSLAKYNSPKEQTEELPLSMVEYWRAQLYSKLLNWLFVHFGCFGSANPLGTEDLLSAERNRDRQLFTPTASLDSSSLISQSFQWKCTQALGEHMKSPAGWWITTLVTTALLSCLKKQWERERTSVCS